jgi:hypothetical protein
MVRSERSESLTEPGKILSMSFWRDEEAVRQWRTVEEHRRIQRAGRESIFADYRLRVAQVIAPAECASAIRYPTTHAPRVMNISRAFSRRRKPGETPEQAAVVTLAAARTAMAGAQSTFRSKMLRAFAL